MPPHSGATLQQRHLSGKTLVYSANTYGATSLGGLRYLTYLTQTGTRKTDLDGSVLPYEIVTSAYDTYWSFHWG